MKKSIILFALQPLLIAPSAIIISCSNTTDNDNSTAINANTIVKQEIQRIEQLKNQLSLKIEGEITKEKIQALNAGNILDNLNNWTNGEIANQPQEKFTYLVETFNNGLNQNSKEKTLSFFINVSYLNVSQKTSKISIQYQLQTDKPPVVPDLPTDQLFDPEGGQITNTNLNASAYKNLISSLNLLNDQTYLPSINDKILLEALKQKPEFKDLSLTIEDDSETLSGTLNLQLKSRSKKQIIKPTIIKITGFPFYPLTNNETLQYHGFEINSKIWFDQKLPIKTTANLASMISQISTDQWNQVLENFKISLANNAGQNFGNAKDLKLNGFSFDVKSVYDSARDQIKLTITIKFIHKKYKNKNWVDTNEVSIWNQATNRDSIVKLFTKTDLQQFIVDQTTINEDELASKTPSYYLGKQYYYKSIGSQFNNDQDLFNNTYLEDDDFTGFYFQANTKLSLSFNQDSISADDWNNTLSFSVALVVNDQIENKSKTFSFKNKNKAITDILKGKLKSNEVEIKLGSSFSSKIIAHLKQNHKNDIDQLFANGADQEHKTFKDFNQALIPQQIVKSILNYDNETETVANFEKLKKDLEPAIFSNPITLLTGEAFDYEESNTLNFSSHLYRLSQGNNFVIEQIQYKFVEPKVTIELVKTRSYIKVNLLGQTVIDFTGNNLESEKEIPTIFSFNLFEKDWLK